MNALNVSTKQNAVKVHRRVNDFLNSWDKKQNRVVVFAGVFDPVHIAHISAAEEALKTSGSKLVFLPEKVPQHKKNVTDYRYRLEMLKIATKLQLNIEVLDYPNNQQYIKGTFEWLRDKYKDNEFVWLVGSDVLNYIEKWPDSEKLKSYGVVEILVFIREEQASEIMPKKIHDVPVRYLRRPRNKTNHQKLSSRYILEDLLHRQGSLPNGVYEYIKNNNLYNVSDSSVE